MSNNCTDCEPLEGGSIITISEPQKAYCEQCGDDANHCIEKMDAQCVYYHYNHPELPTTLENLGIASNTDLQTILEAINDLVGQNLNVSITPEDTATINMTASGAANHTIKADVISSGDAGNILQIRSSGVFVPNTSDGKVKVNGTDASDYLVNQVVGDANGAIAIDVFDDSGLLTISPSLNLSILIGSLCSDSAFLSCLTSHFTETSLVATDTSTIDFTTSGTHGHALTAAVKISADAGNQVAAHADGLYVASNSSITADNGLTKTSNNIQLGGALLDSSTISGSAHDLLFTTRTVNIGNNNGHYDQALTDVSGMKLAVSNTYTQVPSSGLTQSVDAASVTIAAGASLLSGRVMSSDYNALTLNGTVNWTVGLSNPIATSIDVLVLNPATGTTISPTQSGIRAISGSAVVPVLQSTLTTTTGAVSHVAGISVYGPQQENVGGTFYPKITNYYGLLLQDSREYLVIDNTVITNSYGVYQEGASDINHFFGEIRYHNGLTNASDGRVKDELSEFNSGLSAIKQIRPITYKYKETYQKNSSTFVGIIAQEVEAVLPLAIKQGKNKEYDDFRFYDDKPVLYSLVNAVKELSAQIDELKAQIDELKK